MARGRIAGLYEAYLKKAPRQSRSRAVVEAILSAASQRLASAGDESDVTVHDVAKRAGVGVGSLYDYFTDRKSLLAGLVAKVTEDNLVAFEAVLARTQDMPIRESVRLVVAHAFETYATDRRTPRAVLRIAHGMGLMPVLAASQDAFATALAASLRKRADVRDTDLDAAAFVATNAVMGVLHTLVWQDEPAFDKDAVQTTLVDFCVAHLARDDVKEA